MTAHELAHAKSEQEERVRMRTPIDGIHRVESAAGDQNALFPRPA